MNCQVSSTNRSTGIVCSRAQVQSPALQNIYIHTHKQIIMNIFKEQFPNLPDYCNHLESFEYTQIPRPTPAQLNQFLGTSGACSSPKYSCGFDNQLGLGTDALQHIFYSSPSCPFEIFWESKRCTMNQNERYVNGQNSI